MLEETIKGDKIKTVGWGQIKEGLQGQTKEFRPGSEGDRVPLQVLGLRYDTEKGMLGDALYVQL